MNVIHYFNILLSGFSQGAMMSLFCALYGKLKVAGVLSYSGMLVPNPHSQIIHKPQLKLLHGDEDQVVPLQACYKTIDFLKKHKVPMEYNIERGIGHTITNSGLNKGGEFLANLISKINK